MTVCLGFVSGPVEEHFTNCSTSADVFLQYFDMPIIDNILYQSNLYINQKNLSISHITRNEFYVFLGINLVMSYHQLPSWTDYWKSDEDLSVPFTSSMILVKLMNLFPQVMMYSQTWSSLLVKVRVILQKRLMFYKQTVLLHQNL